MTGGSFSDLLLLGKFFISILHLFYYNPVGLAPAASNPSCERLIGVMFQEQEHAWRHHHPLNRQVATFL
jgi:hypothetical protein